MKFSKTVIFFLLISLVGLLRENTFREINRNLKSPELIESHKDSGLKSYLPETQKGLISLKWALTAGFLLTFAFLGSFMVYLCFSSIFPAKITMAGYLLILFAAALFYAGGWILVEPGQGYLIARKLIGVTYTPLFPLVFILVFYFSRPKITS